MSLKLLLPGLMVISLCVSTCNAALVLHYEFESETGGVVDDVSGFGSAIDLTLNNGALIVSDGTRGNVLSLDGINDYGSTAANTAGNKLDTQSSLTMMAWVHTTATTRSAIATRTNGPGYFLELNTAANSGLVTSHVGGPGSDIVSTSAINDGEWQHVAMTYDGSAQRLFINGIEEAMASPTVTDGSQTHPFFVGALRMPEQSDDRTFAGLIDDVRVYNTALTASEIRGVSGVPEPASIATVIAGLVGLALVRRQTK